MIAVNKTGIKKIDRLKKEFEMYESLKIKNGTNINKTDEISNKKITEPDIESEDFSSI